MYSVVIIDDDKNVCDFLQMTLRENAPDFNVRAVCGNGKTGIASVTEIKPDLIILDLEMPVMNGIDFLNALNKIGLSSTVVVLSCHDEFDFVRDAMKLGAVEYILKHRMKAKQIVETLYDAVHYGRMSRLQGIELPLNTELLNQEEIVESNESDRSKESKTAAILLTFLPGLSELAMKKTLSSSSRRLERYPVRFVQRKTPGFLTAFIDIPDTIHDSSDLRRYLYSLGMDIVPAVQVESDDRLLIGISTLQRSCENHLNFIDKVSECIWDVYYRENERVFLSEENQFSNDLSSIYFKLQDFAKAKFDLKNGKRVLDELFFEILRKKIFPPILRNVFRSLFSQIQTLSGRSYGEEKKLYAAEAPISATVSLSACHDWFSDIYNRASLEFERLGHGNYRREVSETIQFIGENFNRSITLEEVAEHVGRSSAYLSRLFKGETGDTFQQYLLKYRINKAKDLLSAEDMKISAVASSTGFINSQHFHHAFRKSVNCTPSEFRRSAQNKNR